MGSPCAGTGGREALCVICGASSAPVCSGKYFCSDGSEAAAAAAAAAASTASGATVAVAGAAASEAPCAMRASLSFCSFATDALSFSSREVCEAFCAARDEEAWSKAAASAAAGAASIATVAVGTAAAAGAAAARAAAAAANICGAVAADVCWDAVPAARDVTTPEARTASSLACMPSELGLSSRKEGPASATSPASSCCCRKMGGSGWPQHALQQMEPSSPPLHPSARPSRSWSAPAHSQLQSLAAYTLAAALLALSMLPSKALIMTILGVAGWLGLCGADISLDCCAFCFRALASCPSIMILFLSDTTGGFSATAGGWMTGSAARATELAVAAVAVALSA